MFLIIQIFRNDFMHLTFKVVPLESMYRRFELFCATPRERLLSTCTPGIVVRAKKKCIVHG